MTFVVNINSDSYSALFLKAILSVCPSIRHNRDGLNGLRSGCRNTFHTVRQSDVSSFFNFLDVKFRSPECRGSLVLFTNMKSQTGFR